MGNTTDMVDNTVGQEASHNEGAMESRAEKVRQIKELEPMVVALTEPLSKKDAEKISRSFGEMKNHRDGRVVTLPNSTIGKIIGHHGFNVTMIAGELANLYITSVPAWSEPEIQKEGHKRHPNIEAYHHYVNKFVTGDGEYFIRFVVNERKVKPGKKGGNYIHSTAISDVRIYKNGDSRNLTGIIDPGRTRQSPFIDKKLQQFFDSVKFLM